MGSRKYRIVRYRGEWHDLILLSVTRDEFVDFLTTGPHPEAHDGQLLQESPDPYQAIPKDLQGSPSRGSKLRAQ